MTMILSCAIIAKINKKPASISGVGFVQITVFYEGEDRKK
ncbi:hypothetical protein SAMN02745174_01667 [Cetobacterium ceti]|uniref:Uncharacterized protein n=1 Tax=Cetobacterium ceti TaxID=180163 RepID=A0A1T4NV31_9FUSO|nr:hypothetical protein SAMN02745174_01667 [Cetobacterium ceti]